MWSHVSGLYEDIDTGTITRLHKLTKEHVKLSSYARMKVKYAVQVCHGSLFTFIFIALLELCCVIYGFQMPFKRVVAEVLRPPHFTAPNESSDKNCNLRFQTKLMQLFSKVCTKYRKQVLHEAPRLYLNIN